MQSDYRRLRGELHPADDCVPTRVDLVDEPHSGPLRMAGREDIRAADPHGVRRGRNLGPEGLWPTNEPQYPAVTRIDAQQSALISPIVGLACYPQRAKAEGQLVGVDRKAKHSQHSTGTCINPNDCASTAWTRGRDRNPESVFR